MPRNAILARNLGQIVESLQSIPRHHHGLFMIDYINKNYAGSKYYEEAVRRWAPFTGTNHEIGVTISGRPVEIYATGSSRSGSAAPWSATRRSSPTMT